MCTTAHLTHLNIYVTKYNVTNEKNTSHPVNPLKFTVLFLYLAFICT